MNPQNEQQDDDEWGTDGGGYESYNNEGQSMQNQNYNSQNQMPNIQQSYQAGQFVGQK